MKGLKKLSKLMLILVVMSLMLTACGKEEVKEVEEVKENTEAKDEVVVDDKYPIEISNYRYDGEEVVGIYEKAPEKVVAVYQNSIETLLALGLEDRIVAAAGLDHPVKDEYKAAFEKLNYLEEFAPDKETVVMLQPDMILSWYSLFSDKNLGEVDYWNEKGINTYMSLNSGAAKDRTLENEYTDILNLGKIFDVEDKAEEIVNEIKDEVKKVQEYVKDNNEERTVLLIERLGDRNRVFGINSLGGDMVTSLGATLLNEEGHDMSSEDIVNLNPDVIFSIYMDRGDDTVKDELVEIFTKDKALQNINAVKNNEVYPIPLGEMYSSGVRTIDGILTFAKGIYPKLYN